MMAVLFLATALIVPLLGLAVLALKGRKSQPWDSEMRQFRSRLDALRPRDDDEIRWAVREASDPDGRTSAGS